MQSGKINDNNTNQSSLLHKLRTAKFLNSTLIVISLLCVVFFLVLFYSVRFEPDDMVIGLELRQSSFWEVFVYKYNFYSFRPVYTLIAFLTMGYSGNTDLYQYSVFAFYVCLYFFFVFTIYKLTKEIFSVSNENRFLLICFSTIQVACLYFLTTERIEIFGWLSASAIHLVPVVFAFFSGWLIIKKEIKKTDYAFLIIGAMFVSGGAQHVAPALLMGGVCVLALLIYQKRKLFTELKKNPIIIKTVFFLGLLALFCLLFTTNPGMRLHYQTAVDYVSANADQYHFNLAETLAMFFKPYKVLGFGLVIVSWLMAASVFEMKVPKIKLKYFLVMLICAGIVVVSAEIVAYNTLMIARVWFIFDSVLFVTLVAVTIKYGFEIKSTKAFLSICSLLTVLLLLGYNANHISALLRFSSEHDKIVKYLQGQDSGKVVVVERFPLPDLTNQVALNEDPQVGENQLFCRFYNIKAKVSVKK